MQKKVREKIKNENYTTRLIVYLLGLFIMTLGISMSVKSDLGVSPVSSIPYTITCITGLEMGKATIVFHIALVALQIVILRGISATRKVAHCLRRVGHSRRSVQTWQRHRIRCQTRHERNTRIFL